MDAFYFKLLLSFLMGGSFIAFTIWLSERYGSKIGGAIIGLPSTCLMGLVFISLTSGESTAVAAIPIMPTVAGINSVFVALFVLFYKQGWKKALAAASLFWLAAISLALWIHLDSLVFSLALAAILYAVSTIYLSRFPHRKVAAHHSTAQEFIFRAAFAGSIIASAVLLAKVNGPLWGGVFSNFPAAFLSTLLLISGKHGADFMASVGRTMAFSSLAAVSFTLVFYSLVIPLGLILGTALGILVSIMVGLAIYKLAL